ncbi:MAG TPA: aminodeoxychorismate synthase component I [Longimicrobiales bacterium]|nr:aminodeoxychorismate synthase component I [Longimicrobiales bacterium]
MHRSRAMLDFPGSGRQAFERPRRIVRADRLADVRPALREAAAEAARGAWVVGFVAYEAAPAFDAALATRAPSQDLPLAWMGVFDGPAAAAAPAAQHAGALDWRTHTSRDAYDVAIGTIRDAIAAGDVYQVNHTLRFHARCDVDPQALFDTLTGARHGRYHALIETPDWAVVSASPELFFELCDGVVTTRPMKGTIRRGRWPAEDDAAYAILAGSPKDRAENLMIVDLLRNDLGRIAEFGSVSVPRLYDVETYPTVHQLTSTITGTLRDDAAIDDIFAAMFPCGSITGAPKFTAMRAIAALEDEPRGAYCGAIGVMRPDGSATFNVAIRTVVLDRVRHTAVYGSGGGITWDSVADAEYDEVIAKAALLTESIPPFALLETLRADDGVIARLERHLRRLGESAAYWDFPAGTADAARRTLEDVCASSRGRALRVRLTAARDGTIDVACTPLDAHDDVDVRDVALATTPVCRSDRLLFHKTTARSVYEQRRAEQPGAFDVLLFNEQGEVTEFTIGNVVVELVGELCTPPLECGLLGGCMRAQLIEDGTIVERVIRVDDLARATHLWLVNSVREWVPVRLR